MRSSSGRTLRTREREMGSFAVISGTLIKSKIAAVKAPMGRLM
jgi:hypothetical protein